MRKACLVVHYGEIALKGKNRVVFEKKLAANIFQALKDLEHRIRIERLRGRIVVWVDSVEESWVLVERLEEIFGIANFAVCLATEKRIEEISETAVYLITKFRRNARTFKIAASRADKSYPYNSLEINRRIGSYVVEKLALNVDLKNPDTTLNIEILPEYALVCLDKVRGLGGLPVGSSGRVIALISGGIDSPLAAWMLAKRGASVDLVHFYPFTHLDFNKIKKILVISRTLTKYLLVSTLFLLSCECAQSAIEKNPEARRYATLLFRLFMLRTAGKLSDKIGARALVTGDSLGQVASQTLPNIAALYKLSDKTVLAPLIGLDKEEIMLHASRIGTYQASIIKYPDCCTQIGVKSRATSSEPQKLVSLYESAKLPRCENETLKDTIYLRLRRIGNNIVVSELGRLEWL